MKKSNPVSNLNQEEIEMLWQEKGAKDWYEDYQQEKEENEKLRKELLELKKEMEQLKEKLKKLNQRTSENSSQPPSSDAYKKKVAKTFGQKGKKEGQNTTMWVQPETALLG
jgi:predicted  nucleic acid-binding Zn-ribbon protein